MTDQDLHGVQERAVEWAKRNGFEIFFDDQHNGVLLTIKPSSYRYIYIDPFGGVEIEQRRHLGSEEAEVRFGEKQMTVDNPNGETYYVSQKKWPV